MACSSTGFRLPSMVASTCPVGETGQKRVQQHADAAGYEVLGTQSRWHAVTSGSEAVPGERHGPLGPHLVDLGAATGHGRHGAKRPCARDWRATRRISGSF